LRDGIRLARESIQSGNALSCLNKLTAFTQKIDG
jgi:anthranilate phosphoribosyltransferase